MSEIFVNRPYDDNPYLKFPGAIPFRIKLGLSLPTLRAYVYQKSNLFGDATPLETAGLEITFQLFDNSGLLIASGPAMVSNLVIDQDTQDLSGLDIAQVEYTFQPFDIKNLGSYYGLFIFRDIDGSTFALPSKDRIQIIVF